MNEAKEYLVMLTEPEMQSVANALAGFFNRLADEKKSPSEAQARNILSALSKMKIATELKESKIILPG